MGFFKYICGLITVYSFWLHIKGGHPSLVTSPYFIPWFSGIIGYYVLNYYHKKEKGLGAKKGGGWGGNKASKKPTCVTVWGIWHLFPILGFGFVALIYDGGAAAFYKNFVGSEDEQYRNFRHYNLYGYMCIAAWSATVGIGVLLSKGWARKQMVELQMVCAVYYTSFACLDFFYFMPKHNIQPKEGDLLFSCIFVGMEILLCFWCRANMTRSDVIGYFDNPTRFDGYEAFQDDEDDDELAEVQEDLRKYSEMVDQGLISSEDYEKLKKRLLGI